MKKYIHSMFTIDLWQLLCQKMKMDYYQFFFAQFRPIWNNLSSITQNNNVGHFSHSVFITELKFLDKMTFSQKFRILRFTTFLLGQYQGEFSNSTFLAKSHF